MDQATGSDCMQLGAANWVTFSANEMIYSVKRDHMLVKEGWGLHCALSHIMNEIYAYMFNSRNLKYWIRFRPDKSNLTQIFS